MYGRMNRWAAEIVNRLLMVFSLRPDLIDPEFRTLHDPLRKTDYMKWYRDRTKTTGVRISEEVVHELALEFMIGHEKAAAPTIDDVIRAKDYVASMTDHRAQKEFEELFK